jgi:hypothetical protein
MIIRNHHTGLIHIPFGHARAAKLKLQPDAGVRLLPGVNDVLPEHWDLVKGVPVVQAMLKKGAKGGLEVFGEKVAETDLARLDENQACALVEECVDVELLAKWLDGEKRKPVIKALKHQIDELKLKGETAKSDGTTDEGDEGEPKS